MKKLVISFGLTTTLAFGAIATPAVFAKPIEVTQSQKEKFFDHKVINQLNVDNIYNNIAYLSETPRVAGTEAEHNAVQYIKEQFESYGYETEIQPFTFYGYTPQSSIELSVNGYDGTLQPSFFTYTVNGNVSGELVYAGLGTVAELQDTDLTGKIVLIQRGEISFAEKVLNAAEKGALGVFIFNNTSGAINGTLGEANDKYVPCCCINESRG